MNTQIKGYMKNAGMQEDDFVKLMMVKNPNGDEIRVHVQANGIVSAAGIPENMKEDEFRTIMNENGFEIISEESYL